MAIDLVCRLLDYTPATRLTPFEACAHAFFDELRDPDTRLPNGSLPALFNFSQYGSFTASSLFFSSLERRLVQNSTCIPRSTHVYFLPICKVHKPQERRATQPQSAARQRVRVQQHRWSPHRLVTKRQSQHAIIRTIVHRGRPPMCLHRAKR